MPNRHDRIAIIATKHGTNHLSETPDIYGKDNYYRILSWTLGRVGTYESLTQKDVDNNDRLPEGGLLPAPIPRPDGGYY